MQIEIVDINKIKPYAKNAKKHPQKQIEQIKRSIEEFGFNDAIAIDENNMIIEGHGRYEALKQMGATEVECVRLLHLTEQQKKAYILVHNKLTMNTGFDTSLLNDELAEIEDFDMEEFDFKFEAEDDLESYYGDARENTYNQYNLHEYDGTKVVGKYDMPTLKACKSIPKELIGFNYVLTTKKFDKGVHFFLDDYQFERIWQRPSMYIEKLKKFDCVLTPDFSLYLDMPASMKIWNVYRSKLIGQQMQKAGIEVIPTLQWAEPASFDYCFDGIEKGGTVAVSTIGVKKTEEQLKIWFDGMDEAIKRIKPSTVLCYGGDIGYKFNCNVIYYDNKAFKHNE